MSFIICQESDKNGHMCGETSNSSLKIFNEVKKIYEDRLKRIDQEAGCGDGTQLKLKTMQSWIEDLEKQNACLVQVVEQLEHEAEERIFVPAPHTSRSQIDKIKELEEEVEKLRRNVTELKSDREKLKNILESANISIKELEYKEQDSKIKLETMRTNLSSKEQVATNLEEMVKILQDSLNIAQKEKEEINRNLRQCNADRCDLEHAQSKIKSLQEENKDLRTERTELLKTIKEQAKEGRVVCPNKIQKVSDRSSAEESDYENEESGSEGQKTKMSSKGDWHINQLVELVDAQNNKIIHFEDNVTKLKINYNAVTERNKILEAEMDTLKQELEDYRQHTDESEARTSKSQAQADDCHITMDFLQEKISVLKDLLREKSDNGNLLQAEYEALQNELSHAQLDYEELEERSNRELDRLRKDLNKLTERLRECECDNQNLIEDEKKHQKMLLEAANREIKVQQDCTQREKEMMVKIQSAQSENIELSDTVVFLREELQNMKCEMTERDVQLNNISSQHRICIETIEKLQTEKCFLQSKLHKQESSNKKRLSVLQNKIAQCEKQKLILEREVTCTREAIRELSEICESKTNYLKNFKIQLLEVPVCHDEVCSKSNKTVKTVGACLKELCKDNKNLKEGIRERDEIINKLMQKEKEQEELLRKARKQIAILLKALKSSKRRESGLLETLCPVMAAEHPLDHRISSSVWDIGEILDERSDIDNENVLNIEEAEGCYCSNLHQV